MSPWKKKQAATPVCCTRPILPCIASTMLCISFIFLFLQHSPHLPRYPVPINIQSSCNFSRGKWVRSGHPPRLRYNYTCPFHRNSWNCVKNRRKGIDEINSWTWVPEGCGSGGRGEGILGFDPAMFLRRMEGRNIGFVGDSLNENFVVAFLCSLREGDGGAKKTKRRNSWRGGYFPKFNVTVGYHRSVLLAKYQWQSANESKLAGENGLKGIYRVDVDVPADDWINATTFYDVLVFNTGHWWGFDKFPKETPLVFFRDGKAVMPALGLLDGFELVLSSMVQYIEREVPRKTMKFWRTQSPRHFHGGDWNQNGSCLFKKPLKEDQLDAWFEPANNGINKEARMLNKRIWNALQGTDIKLLDLTYLSEFRADAHPALWLGREDALSIWGQDCLHWCLPGLPDTWVDILAAKIIQQLDKGFEVRN